MEGATDLETGALVLLGGADRLADFARRLRQTTTVEVALEDVARAAPMLRALSSLRITPGDGDVVIRIAGDIAVLAGSAQARAWLASEIETILDANDWAEPGMHAHIDAGEGELAHDSVDLVIVGPVSQAALDEGRSDSRFGSAP